MSWSRSLSTPIRLNDGHKLITLDDASEFVLGLPEGQLHKACWEAAIELLIEAAIARPSALAEAEAQLKLAFRIEGLL
jgi:hypothetical protein